MFDTRKAIWTPLSWRDAIPKSASISGGVTLRDRSTRDDSNFDKSGGCLTPDRPPR